MNISHWDVHKYGTFMAYIIYNIYIDIDIDTSDVWLTVHRNSVWIRKTN